MSQWLKVTFLCSLLTCSLCCSIKVSAQTFCYPGGNVIIYSNYDGGYLNIDVDENIPDLKIGITTYEKCAVTIGGQYAGNVTEVIYAGYNGDNDHCNPTLPTTSISGVPDSITTILLYPPVTWPNSNGYYYIICNFDCDSSSNQGGCNTPDQVVHYYLTQFGGLLYYHYTQYGCWSGTHHVSAGGNCCIGASIIDPQFSINAAFSVPNDTLCAKDSVSFVNTSLSSYPGNLTYSWNFGDGTPVSNDENPTHIYGVQGYYLVTLIATNSAGTASDTTQMNLTLINCFTGLPEVPSASGEALVLDPVTGEWCFEFTEVNMPGDALKIFDQLGNLILDSKLSAGLNNYCINQALEKFSDGLYLAVVTRQDISRTYKLLLH